MAITNQVNASHISTQQILRRASEIAAAHGSDTDHAVYDAGGCVVRAARELGLVNLIGDEWRWATTIIDEEDETGETS